MNVYKWCKVERVLYLNYIPILPMFVKVLIRIIWGGVIPYQTEIGYQGLGIVIHKRCVIGKNCFLSQNVTLGGKYGLTDVPIIGDNVHIGAGAVLIGPIHVGNNVHIGANAVVNRDIPDNCVAAGVPAKIIKYINSEK